jgi:hypothetical protein
MGTGRSAATSAEEVRNAPEQMMSHVNHIDFRREIDWTVMVCNFHYMLQQFQISGENPVGFSIFGILWMEWRCDWIGIL